jgi:3-hydroxyisobutyrate dehydrogenase-like beta-hydroxyacid dehydrogenase
MRLAFLGLGRMGVAMARRLENAGFDLTVYRFTYYRPARWLQGEGNGFI